MKLKPSGVTREQLITYLIMDEVRGALSNIELWSMEVDFAHHFDRARAIEEVFTAQERHKFNKSFPAIASVLGWWLYEHKIPKVRKEIKRYGPEFSRIAKHRYPITSWNSEKLKVD